MPVTEIASRLDVVALLVAASRSADADGPAVDIDGYESNMLVVLDSTATAAPGDTLDVTLEERVDATDSWAAVPADALYNPATGANATFAQVVNGAASFQVLALRRNRLKAQIRARGNLSAGGAGVYGVHLIAAEKYTNWS